MGFGATCPAQAITTSSSDCDIPAQPRSLSAPRLCASCIRGLRPARPAHARPRRPGPPRCRRRLPARGRAGVPRGGGFHGGGGRRVQGHRELLQGAHPVPRSALLQSESETHGSVRSAPTSRRIDLKAPPTENCRPVRSGRNNPRDVQSPLHGARGAKGGKKGSDPQTLEPPPFPSGAC